MGPCPDRPTSGPVGGASQIGEIGEYAILHFTVTSDFRSSDGRKGLLAHSQDFSLDLLRYCNCGCVASQQLKPSPGIPKMDR